MRLLKPQRLSIKRRAASVVVVRTSSIGGGGGVSGNNSVANNSILLSNGLCQSSVRAEIDSKVAECRRSQRETPDEFCRV